MNRRSLLTRFDHQEYILRLLFKPEGGYLAACVDRAYLDVRRRIKGLSQVTERADLEEQAKRLVRELLVDLQSGKVSIDGEQAYDRWHQAACRGLQTHFSDFGYAGLTVGHAQRWVNQSLRYIYALGEDRVAGFGDLYPLCHAPLDLALTNALADYGAPKLSVVWSRLDRYDEYLAYQCWIRGRFRRVPLDVDLLIGLGKDPEGTLTV